MPHKATDKPMEVSMPPHGIAVFESHHAHAFRMKPDRHSWLELFYVIEGRGEFVIDGRPSPCTVGDVVVVPMRAQHLIEDEKGNPLALYGVRVAPRVWKKFDDTTGDLKPGTMPANPILSKQICSEFRHLLFEQLRQREGYEMMMTAGVFRVLALLQRAQRDTPLGATRMEISDGLRGIVEQYVDTVQHEFYLHETVDSVAQSLGMSRRRFTDLFKQVTGDTWARYVRKVRIDHAKHLLTHTNRSVASIAFESGFEELSSFYRAFTDFENVSPVQWRKEVKSQRMQHAALEV